MSGVLDAFVEPNTSGRKSIAFLVGLAITVGTAAVAAVSLHRLSKQNNSADRGGSTPQRSPQPPKIGKPRMDHRVLSKEIKPDSSNAVRSDT